MNLLPTIVAVNFWKNDVAMAVKQYKISDNNETHRTEKPRVIVSGRGTLSLDMQNPDVLQGLFDSLNPEREKEIIRLQEEIKRLRNKKAYDANNYGGYAVTEFPARY